MKRRDKHFNSKRKIANQKPFPLIDLSNDISYGGNPEHKKSAGDFRLTPPSVPMSDKSKCDETGIVTRGSALDHLRRGAQRGLVSEKLGENSRFPQNIWAVTADGIPLEAQLENGEKGTYHGYPLLMDDSFRDAVLERWNNEP